ncbi:MAG: NAD(P)H-dependent glycerol-3-phosphate dehydrogenase [Bianqueaceae bacterium]
MSRWVQTLFFTVSAFWRHRAILCGLSGDGSENGTEGKNQDKNRHDAHQEATGDRHYTEKKLRYGFWELGTALAVLLAENGRRCALSYRQEEAEAMAAEGENGSFSWNCDSKSIQITWDCEKALTGRQAVVLATPSSYLRSTLQRFKGHLERGALLINVAKGLEESTLQTLGQVIAQECPEHQVAALSGPSHAEEVSRKIPTTVVASSASRAAAERTQGLFMNEYFRVYTNPDLLGVELGGALKNVIALAAGISDGLGCGDNTKAALMTRGITEIARLGTAMGADFHTFNGLSGIGDLIVTCTSMHSRNRRAEFSSGGEKFNRSPWRGAYGCGGSVYGSGGG